MKRVPEFKVKTPIVRSLMLLAAALVGLFLVDFVSAYWTNRALVLGLQRVHETNQLYDLGTRSLDGLSTAIAQLRAAPETPSLRDARIVFETSLSASRDTLAAASERDSVDARSKELITQARGSLNQLMRTGSRLISDLQALPPEERAAAAEDGIVIASQFELEAREQLRKLQIHLRESADISFEEVYGIRNRPIYVMGILSLVFLIAAAALGIPTLRRLSQGLNGLLVATDEVARGNLGYRARVQRQDELGKMTYAFNRMLAVLQTKETDERVRAEEERERLEFLADSAEKLSRSLDYQETLAALATVAVPYLADWCAVDVIEEDGTIRRTSVAHADPSKSEMIKTLDRFKPDGASDGAGVVSEVIRTGRTILHNDVSEDLLRRSTRNAEHAAFLRQLGFRSGLCVPIRIRERTLGAISFVLAREGRRYTGSDQFVAEDLARRAATAIENARLYRDAQDAVRLRDEFLSIASHELRTPLTPLRMQIQTLGRALARSDEPITQQRVGRFLDVTDRMVSRLAGLVDDLLDISRINSGVLSLRYGNFDLVEMVHEVLERFKGALEKHGCPATLVAPVPVHGTWDRVRLEQVVTNLLTNAMKYGEGHPVEIIVSYAGDQAEIAVKDHGVGIAPEDQARIFNRFERASSSAHYGGLGLGLYITSQILKLHGGSVTVSSEIGRGSVFRARLPLAPAAAILPPESPASERGLA